MENKLENNSAEGKEGESERERNNHEKNKKLKAKHWRMWVLMTGIGIRFSLGVSLFFNSPETPLSEAFGLPGTLPRARSRLSPGTAAPRSCSSEASSQASFASPYLILRHKTKCARMLMTFLIPSFAYLGFTGCAINSRQDWKPAPASENNLFPSNL